MPSLGEVNGRYTPGTSASRAPRAAPAQSGPGHRPTAAPRGAQRTEAGGRLPHPGQQDPGPHSGAPRSVTATRTVLPPALTATVPLSPGAPGPPCRTLPAETSPARQPYPRTGDRDRPAARKRTGDPRPLHPPARPPGKHRALPHRQPSHQHTCRPAALRSRAITRAGRTPGDPRPARARPSSPETPPARPVRGRP